MEQLNRFFAPPSDDTDKTTWAKVKRFLVPPIFEDEEKTRIGRITHTVLLIMLIATLIIPGIYLIRAVFIGEAVAQLLGVMFIAGSSLLAFLALNKRGHIYTAASALTLLFLLQSFYLIYGENSLDNSLVVNFTIAIIIAGLLLGPRASGLTVLASIILIGTASVDEVTTIRELLGSRLIAYAGLFLAINFLIRLASDSIRDALIQLRHSNQELQDARNMLETRVSNRTRDLTLAAEIGRKVSQEHSLDQLLPVAVERIRETFSLYYVQIYLADPSERSLTLRAGSGTVGQQLLRRGHRLPIDFGSINGSAAQSKKAVLVEDTAKSISFLPNPLLPNTRSEMSVPLLSGERLLGVLNMQSENPNTFTQETLPAYEILAGQIAAAIANAYQFAEIEQTRIQVEAQSRLLARSGWDSYLDAVHQPEYVGAAYQNGEVETFTTPTVRTSEKSHTIPISVSGEEIGVIQLETQNGALDSEEQEIAVRLATLAGQHMENLRLLAEADRYRHEAEQAARHLVQEGWETYRRSAGELTRGYAYTQNQVIPVTESGPVETVNLSHPLSVRGESIGIVELKTASDVEVKDEETTELVTIVAETLAAHIENLRLTEQTQRSLWEARKSSNELALINHVVSSVASSLDLAHSLEIVADELAQLLFVEQVAIALLDESGKTLTVVAEHHSNPDSVSAVGFQIPIEGNALTQQVIVTRQMVVITDAQNSPLTEPIREAVQQRLIESLYILPILVGNQVIGTVGIDILEPERVINDEELRLAQTIIFQAATAIQNSRLFEQTQAVLAETQALYDLTARLNGVSSLQELLEASAAPAIQDGAAVASLWLLEVDEHGLPQWSTLVTNWRNPSAFSGGLPVNTRLPVHTSSSSQLWVNHPNVPVFIGNIQEDDRVDEIARNIFRQAQVGSSIFMPLAFGTQWLGLVVISWSEPHNFSEGDHRLYRSLTVQTAVVLNNQLLLQQTQQNAERLARLSEIQTRLSQSLDESGILSAITQLIRVDPTLGISFSYLKLDEQDQPDEVEITAMWQQGTPALLDTPISYRLKDFPISQLWINNPNEVLFIPDITTHPDVDSIARETLVQVGVKAMALMPLYAVGQWQGLVSMQWPDSRVFTPDEEFFLSQLQRPLSSVVASRRAYLAAQIARHETEQRAAELAVINQVAESVSQQLDVQQLFITVHEQVRRIMPADGFVVALYDEQEHLVSFPFIYDDGEYYQQGGTVPDPQSRSYQVISTGEMMLLNFTPEEVAEFTTQQRPTVGKPQLPSALIYVPLRIGTKIIGAMSVQNYQGRHYTQTNATILMGIGNHVAVALENSRLFTQTQQRAGELATINEISQVASSELSLDSLIEGLGNKIIQTFRASGGYIAVYDKQTSLIDMPFFIDSASEGQTRIFLPPLRLGEGITSRIIQTRQPLLVVEGTEERLYSMGAQLTGGGTQPNSFLGVPMVVGDEVVGAISIQNMPSKPPFTEADQRLLMTIASTVGVAIQNARLFEQTQRRAERERLVNAITQKIQGAVTVESALQTAIHELGQALRVKQARVMITPQAARGVDTENGRN